MDSHEIPIRPYDPETELPDFRWIRGNIDIKQVYQLLGGKIIGEAGRCIALLAVSPCGERTRWKM